MEKSNVIGSHDLRENVKMAQQVAKQMTVAKTKEPIFNEIDSSLYISLSPYQRATNAAINEDAWHNDFMSDLSQCIDFQNTIKEIAIHRMNGLDCFEIIERQKRIINRELDKFADGQQKYFDEPSFDEDGKEL